MVFGSYADYYDLFYRSKSYAKECGFLQAIFKKYTPGVKTILDLGCGTGGHALALMRRGYQVTGIDASARMLNIARVKALNAKLPLKLVRAQLQDFKLTEKFDAVICMFSVIDYLTTDADITLMLNSVRRYLKPGGIFVCDFWHAPAVASFIPHKSKVFTDGDISVERVSHTRLLAKRRMCEVRYTCLVKNNKQLVRTVKETHRMRYFDIEEMNAYLNACGLRPRIAGPFLNINRPIRKNTWDVAVVACLPVGRGGKE